LEASSGEARIETVYCKNSERERDNKKESLSTSAHNAHYHRIAISESLRQRFYQVASSGTGNNSSRLLGFSCQSFRARYLLLQNQHEPVHLHNPFCIIVVVRVCIWTSEFGAIAAL
jgi:hypothetical protein